MANTLQFHLMTAVLWLLIGLQAFPPATGAPQTKTCVKDPRYPPPGEKDERTAAEIREEHPCLPHRGDCDCKVKDADGTAYCVVTCLRFGWCYSGARGKNAFLADYEGCNKKSDCSPHFVCASSCGF